MKASIIKSFLVLSLTIGFSSCLQNTSDQKNISTKAKGAEQAPLNVVGHWMGEGKREMIVRNYVREFEFLNQNIDVNLAFAEEIGYNRYNTDETHGFVVKVLEQEVPEWDVLVINDDYEGISGKISDPNWTVNNLVDFSDYPEIARNTVDGIDINKIKERWGGIVPGPSLEGQYWALWSNKKVADKIGINVKQYGMTFDEFLSYLKALDKYNNDHNENITFFQEAADWGTIFAVVLQLYISEIGDMPLLQNGEPSEIKLQAWHKTLNALEQLSDYKIFNDDYKSVTWREMNSHLLNEKCLFFTNGSWMYNTWVEEDEEKIQNCVPNEFPVFENATPIYPGGYNIVWAVLKKSPNKERAIKFLIEMSKPEIAESWVRNTKCPTGIKGNVTGVSFGADQFESFSYHVQSTYGTNLYKYNMNAFYIYGAQHIYQPTYFMEVLEGQYTADEALHKIRTEIFAGESLMVNTEEINSIPEELSIE